MKRLEGAYESKKIWYLFMIQKGINLCIADFSKSNQRLKALENHNNICTYYTIWNYFQLSFWNYMFLKTKEKRILDRKKRINVDNITSI